MDRRTDHETAAERGRVSAAGWYELFSRGARDWLRHNEKVRDAVRENLPELISGADVLGASGNRTVKVPVKFLEHYRFRLADAESRRGVGQGQAQPGDILAKDEDDAKGSGAEKGAGGNEGGGVQFVLELKIDEIVDWLWEELKLPNLEAKTGGMVQDEYTREGWDKRGARSRLDRRRSLKESIKRRAIQPEGPAFSNEDLRFRQLVKRDQPATRAVVFFAMDVSSSMTERDRKLAKSFFFWVIQGLRRQYAHIETVYVAHTIEAWEFTESDFFKVKGQGGTVSSTAFNKALEIIDERYDPVRYNLYLFYASDGDNFPEDRSNAKAALHELLGMTSFMGYIETATGQSRSLRTESADMFRALNAPERTGCYSLSEEESVFDAIRQFFQHQAEAG